MLVFSTCWNSHRHFNGEAMIDEILELGFDTVELSHGLKMHLIPGVMKAYEDGRVKIAGVHNFFPSPVDVPYDAPDAYEFTSHREQDRSRALRLTKQSLQYAEKFKAGYIVLHMGRVHLMNRAEGSSLLQSYAEAGKLGMNDYAAAKAKCVLKRRKLAPLYVRRAQEALSALLPDAEACGITLGVESRSHLEQVPSEDEMRDLMVEFAHQPKVGYWHDFGHVQRKHNLRILNHSQWLREMSPYLVGCHVNDVKWPSYDHQVPFAGGDVDFKTLMRWVKPGIPLVWELSGSRTAEAIRESLAMWREKFPEHC